MKTFAIVEDGQVTNLIIWDGVAPWEGSEKAVPVPDGVAVAIGTEYDGEAFVIPAPPAAPAPTQADFEAALQMQLDGYAKAWGYDSIVSAASYAQSTNTRFATEAAVLMKVRDDSWTYAEGLTSTPASVAVFLAAAPAAPVRPKV